MFINVSPKLDLPETVNDEHVHKIFIVDIPLTFKDDKQVTLFNVVKPETFSDEEEVTALLEVVYPVTYNNVF